MPPSHVQPTLSRSSTLVVSSAIQTKINSPMDNNALFFRIQVTSARVIRNVRRSLLYSMPITYHWLLYDGNGKCTGIHSALLLQDNVMRGDLRQCSMMYDVSGHTSSQLLRRTGGIWGPTGRVVALCMLCMHAYKYGIGHGNAGEIFTA